jgi:hypothetical protein
MNPRLLLPLIFLPIAVSAQRRLTYHDKTFQYTLTLIDKGDYRTVHTIAVTRRSDHRPVQTIYPRANELRSWPEDEFFLMEDMNFDGFGDIRLLQFQHTFPNLPYYCWLYNPKTGTFQEEKALEDITSPDFEARDKRIYSVWRAGCCEHGTSTYAYLHGKVALMEVEDDAMIEGDTSRYLRTVTRRIDGRMTLVERSVVQEDQR